MTIGSVYSVVGPSWYANYAAAVFLCSPDSYFITGMALPVDSGYSPTDSFPSSTVAIRHRLRPINSRWMGTCPHAHGTPRWSTGSSAVTLVPFDKSSGV